MKERILAIEPGTRELGVAVFDEDRLIYYAVKTIGKGSRQEERAEEVRLIVSRLLSEYESRIIAIKQLAFTQQNLEQVAEVVNAIELLAQADQITLLHYSRPSVRLAICGNRKATKQECTKRIIITFPELAGYANRTSKWERMYYARMLEAVALGLTATLNH